MIIAFIEPNGTIHTRGQIACIHDYDANMEEPEPGPYLQELATILDFVRDSFAPDYWQIEEGKIKRFSKDDSRLSDDALSCLEWQARHRRPCGGHLTGCTWCPSA